VLSCALQFRMLAGVGVHLYRLQLIEMLP